MLPHPVTQKLFRVSLLLFPYLSYLSIAGMIGVLARLWLQFRRSALDALTRNGLLVLTGLLLLSSLFAKNRGEALLQLSNFLPYFAFFAVLPHLLSTTDRLRQTTIGLVLATLPLNLLAIGDYLLRLPALPPAWRSLPGIAWVRARPHAGRAMVMFDHPNSLASYLVLMFGLALGLLLYSWKPSKPNIGFDRFKFAFLDVPVDRLRFWLTLSAATTLMGIFTTGSRNGLLIALSQGLLFVLLKRASRRLVAIGLGVLGAVVAAAATLGLGARSLGITDWSRDPRLRVWQASLELIQARPLLGWGLGNFKFEYPYRLLSRFPACAIEQINPATVSSPCANVTHPHSVWLLLAVEAGLLSLLVLTLWVGWVCFQAVRQLRQPNLTPADRSIVLTYLLGFWGCVAFACFDVTFYDARINMMNWLLLAGLYSASQLPIEPCAQPESQG